VTLKVIDNQYGQLS